MSIKKNHEVSIRSSAAEYLTFVAASGEGGVEAVYADEDVWLSQKMMGVLYDVETHTVNYHLKRVFADNELQADSVIRNFRITAADGKTYDTQHYNLSGIIAVGYKVNSERAVQFRKWATGIIKEFTIKAYVSTKGASRYQHSPQQRAGLCLQPTQIPRSERPTDSMDGGNVHTTIHRSFRPCERFVPFHSPAGYAGIRSLLWSWKT